MEIQIGTSLTTEVLVTDSLTALAVGSGDVAVYATPMLIAQMEHTAATLLAQQLPQEDTSVGTAIQATHDAATPVGQKVTVTASITAVEGRIVSFALSAKDQRQSVSTASHTRVIVDRERFLAKAYRS